MTIAKYFDNDAYQPSELVVPTASSRDVPETSLRLEADDAFNANGKGTETSSVSREGACNFTYESNSISFYHEANSSQKQNDFAPNVKDITGLFRRIVSNLNHKFSNATFASKGVSNLGILRLKSLKSKIIHLDDDKVKELFQFDKINDLENFKNASKIKPNWAQSGACADQHTTKNNYDLNPSEAGNNKSGDGSKRKSHDVTQQKKTTSSSGRYTYVIGVVLCLSFTVCDTGAKTFSQVGGVQSYVMLYIHNILVRYP